LVLLAVQLVGMGLIAELIIHRTDSHFRPSAPISARLEPGPSNSAPATPGQTTAAESSKPSDGPPEVHRQRPS
jgi:hypothetical protein